MGAYLHHGDPAATRRRLDEVLQRFPVLRERQRQLGEPYPAASSRCSRSRGADDPAQAPAARRAVDGPRAAAGGGGVRHHPGDQRAGHDDLPRRAERDDGARRRAPGIRHGTGPHRPARRRRSGCARTRTSSVRTWAASSGMARMGGTNRQDRCCTGTSRRRFRPSCAARGLPLDTDGLRYLDAAGGRRGGHHRPRRARGSARSPTRPSGWRTPTSPSSPASRLEPLAERLIGCAPAGLSKVYFVSGGLGGGRDRAQAGPPVPPGGGNPRKYRIVSRWQAYHGNTVGALSMSSRTQWFRPTDPTRSTSPTSRRLPLLSLPDLPRVPGSLCAVRPIWSG